MSRFPPGKKDDLTPREREQMEIRRVKIPQGREVIGICEQRVGGARMKTRCLDGVNRICRIPGRLKRKLWVREGDVLLIEPWELSTEKGDVLFKYLPSQVNWLKKRGYLRGLEDLEEF